MGAAGVCRSLPAMSPLPPHPEREVEPGHVLLVDDSTADLRLLMELMTLRGLRLSVALDGERGYDRALAQQPGLVLLDVGLPGMDGYAVCRLLKANPLTRQIPVIFLTVADDLDSRLAGFAAGGVDYIAKPFAAQEVLARVGVHLQRRSQAPAAGDAVAVSSDSVLVTAAQRLLREQLASPPELDELARQLGSNRRRLNEAFQALCGQPVFGWFREERLRRAHELVCHSDTALAEIAEALGYASPATFTRAFSERFSLPPREMRALVQAGGKVPAP